MTEIDPVHVLIERPYYNIRLSIQFIVCPHLQNTHSFKPRRFMGEEKKWNGSNYANFRFCAYFPFSEQIASWFLIFFNCHYFCYYRQLRILRIVNIRKEVIAMFGSPYIAVIYIDISYVYLDFTTLLLSCIRKAAKCIISLHDWVIFIYNFL